MEGILDGEHQRLPKGIATPKGMHFARALTRQLRMGTDISNENLHGSQLGFGDSFPPTLGRRIEKGLARHDLL